MELVSYEDLLDQHEQLMAKLEKFREEAAKPLRELFAINLSKIFTAHPELIAVRWHQYTPSFNDGDPCTFSTTELSYQSSDAEGEEDDWHDTWYSPKGPAPKNYVLELKNFEKQLYKMDSELLQNMFGQSVTVFYTPEEGFTTEEFYDY